MFDQDDIGPILEEPRLDGHTSVLPSFEASRILTAQQVDLSAQDKQTFFDEESKRLHTRDNDSADCNLTRSDRPAIFAQLCAEQKREDRVVLGGVTGKFNTYISNDNDKTEIAPKNFPAVTKPDLTNRAPKEEVLALSLTNTFSTIQSLEGDL